MKRSKWFAAATGILIFTSVAFGAGKELVFNLGVEPRTIDPVLNNAVDGSDVVYNVFEGLMRINIPNGSAEPGYAQSWDTSDDGMTWTFHLRDNIKWSDGTPMVAEDFRFGILRTLEEENAAPFAFTAFWIKNGEAFFNGKVKAEDVGISCPDEKTVVFTLEYQTPLLLDYLASGNFVAARRDIVEKNPRGWTTTMPLITNGAFYVDEWKHNNEMNLKKNPYYWDAENVKLDSLRFVMITDSNTAMAAFRGGKVDLIKALPPAMIPILLKSGEAKKNNSLGTSFCVFNIKKPPFDNPLVRRAFNMSIDRQVLVDKVLQGGQKPATAWIPYGVPGVNPGKDFRAEDPQNYLPAQANIEEARKLLAEAGYPDGKGFPQTSYKYNSNPGNKIVAEALQAMWKKNLGIDVKLDNEEWKVFIDTRVQKNFQIARHGYLLDFFDPASLLDLWVTGNYENVADYNNADYDALMKASQSEMDRGKRMELLHKAEQILMRDLPVLPLNYYNSSYMMKEYVAGVYMSPLNWTFFRKADLVQKNAR